MFLRRMRRTRRAAREELQALQEKHRAIEENLLGVFGQVLQRASDASDDEALGSHVRQTLEEEGGVEVLDARFQEVAAYHGNNCLPLLWRIHRSSRAALFRGRDCLEVRSATQDTAFLEALDLVSRSRNARRSHLPLDLDIAFLPEQWRNFVTTRHNGCTVLDRRSFEVAVLVHVARRWKAVISSSLAPAPMPTTANSFFPGRIAGNGWPNTAMRQAFPDRGPVLSAS